MTRRLWAVHRVGPKEYVATPPWGKPPLGELTGFAQDEAHALRMIAKRSADSVLKIPSGISGEDIYGKKKMQSEASGGKKGAQVYAMQRRHLRESSDAK